MRPLLWNDNSKSYAVYRTRDISDDTEFQYCCYFAQLTRDLLAIAKFLVQNH